MNNNFVPPLVFELVENLPMEYVWRMAEILDRESTLDWSRLRYLLKASVPQLDAQERVNKFMDAWCALINPPTPSVMGLLMQTTAFTLERERTKQKVDVIWTGPRSSNINVRRTDQALIELINSARDRVIIVSFAVYKARDILMALEQAALRGVEIKVIIESPDVSEGKIAYNTIRALGSSLIEKVRIYIWPYAKRPHSLDGKYGALHAKCAIVDGLHLYLSSANLTDYAMNFNMEMGIVMQHDDLPKQFERLFEDLITNGTLSQIAQE